jgi:UDP-glucose 4-epimerase
VVELAAADYRPIILDNFSNSEKSVISRLEKLLGQPLTVYEGDFQDADRLQEIFAKHSIDGIIHFAAFKAVGESVAEPLKYYDNNVAHFIHLLQTVVAQKIPRFVFSSSAAVYGNPPTSQVTEDSPCAPESPYGWTKYMNEIILRDSCAATSGLQGVALRYFNVVGAHPSGQIGELPKGAPQNVLPIIVKAAASGQPMKVFGNDYPTPDGTCLRDYIHVVDLAKAHVAALRLEPSKQNYQVFNVGTGRPTSVLELITTFEKVNGVKVPHEIIARRTGDPTACYAIANKAKQALHWQASKRTEDAVRDAWRWQQVSMQTAGRRKQ